MGTDQSWAVDQINNAVAPTQSTQAYKYQFVAGNDRYMGDIRFGSVDGEFAWAAGKFIPNEAQLALTSTSAAGGATGTFGSGASTFYDVGGSNDDEVFDITVAGASTGLLMNSSAVAVKMIAAAGNTQ
jgi:hypothetical protein